MLRTLFSGVSPAPVQPGLYDVSQDVLRKYEGADERLFRLGDVQMLFWRAIVKAKEIQSREFDLGRSDVRANGQIVLKIDRALTLARSVTFVIQGEYVPAYYHYAGIDSLRSFQIES